MAKEISKIIIKIEDDQSWDSMIDLSESKLVCGCCDAMHPSIARVLLDYDSAEERFVYASASIAKVGAKMQASFPTDLNIQLEKNGCLPLFAVYRMKTCLSVVVGVDSPTLLQLIATNIPDKPVKE